MEVIAGDRNEKPNYIKEPTRDLSNLKKIDVVFYLY